jgi:hypothetical protein
MRTFSVGEAVLFGWRTFGKRPWFFVGVFAFVFVAYGILSFVSDSMESGSGILVFFDAIASLVLGIVIEMTLINIALKSHDDVETVQFSDMWAVLPFWYYVGAKMIGIILVFIGFVLLIVPGLFAALAVMFANYTVVDKRFGPIEAVKRSWRITKGHMLQLFLFMLVIASINLLGSLLAGIGLVVTVPVTMLAMARVYRTLEHADDHGADGSRGPTASASSYVLVPFNPLPVMLGGFVFALAPIIVSIVAYAFIPGLNEGQGGLGAVFLLAFATVPIGIVVVLGAIVKWMRGR